jgi:CDP-paratose 2-epimerase
MTRLPEAAESAHGRSPEVSALPQAERGGKVIGAVEFFVLGEHERVKRVLSRLGELGITELRTNVFWSDWVRPQWRQWYDWLVPTLAGKVNILPCVFRTPPWLGVEARESAPPRDVKAYADFIDVLLSRYGDHFRAVELWHDPRNSAEWDVSLDPEFDCFCSMVGMAAYWLRRCGKKAVLCGTSPIDTEWLTILGRRGVLQHIDAVGVHGAPGTMEVGWRGWAAELARVRRVVREYSGGGREAEVWITQAGYSTWRHDERRQVQAFVEASNAQAERMYWFRVEDREPGKRAGAEHDERTDHFGMYTAGGRPKLLARALAEGGIAGGGLERAREAAGIGSRAQRPGQAGGNGAVLITGGAGFIGTNLADRLAGLGRRVIVLDNLSRAGVERNAEFLRRKHGGQVEIRAEDVRNARQVRAAVAEADEIYHFAAQVAVTTSLTDPVEDFTTNVGGTVTLLEEVRRRGRGTPVIFTSTNKVYGHLLDVEMRQRGQRYEPADHLLKVHGVPESRPLQFSSPYACSKGAADQYVLDFAASYGIPTCVFRMSCIYGPHQCGNEDQGWIAHFLMRAMKGEAISIYGDGRQVRDALFVEDLVDAFLAARRDIARLSGRSFNIGGGPTNTVSVLEVLETIGVLTREAPTVEFGPWRTGDQRWYVSDIRSFCAATTWMPQVRVAGGGGGIARLHQWLSGQGPVARDAHETGTEQMGAFAR